MAFKYGFQSKVGFGEESTYGTAVAPSDWCEFISESVKETYEKRASQGINGTSMAKKFLSLGRSVAGDVAFEVNPDDVIGMILKAFFGAAPTSAQVGTTSYYTHTFKGADDWIADGVAGCGLTCQITRDDVAWDYSGCLPSGINLVSAVGDTLKATVSLVGQKGASQGSPTAASYSTQNPFIFHQGVVTRGGSPISVTNFQLKMDNGVKADTYLLGQNYIKRPARGMRAISGQVEMFFEDSNIYNAFTGNTDDSIVLTFTSGSYSLTITMSKVYFTNNPTPNVSNAGVITYTAPFTSIYKDATDQDIKIALVNTATSI